MSLLPTFNRFGPLAQLPPEVLVLIFELATYNSTREIDKLAGLPPFEEEVYAEERMNRDRGALQTKHALALTCFYFRKLIMCILYEDVWLQHGSGSEALLKVLHGSRNASGYGLGRFVKIIALTSMLSTSTGDVISEILSLCPNLRALFRLPAATGEQCKVASSDDSNSNLSFSQLHRIDWPSTCLECMSGTDMSPSFVRCSCLRILSLNNADHFFPDRNIQPGDEQQILIDLPQLHTLRLKSCDVLGDPEEFRFAMNFPSLRRIVLERPLALYALHAGCLSTLGPQIKTLELGGIADSCVLMRSPSPLDNVQTSRRFFYRSSAPCRPRIIIQILHNPNGSRIP